MVANRGTITKPPPVALWFYTRLLKELSLYMDLIPLTGYKTQILPGDTVILFIQMIRNVTDLMDVPKSV